MSLVALSGGLDQLGPESFLAALVGSSDDAIIGKTPDGCVVFWNAAAEHLYGYKSAEMLGRDISVLIPEDRPDERSFLLDQVQKGLIVRAFQTERRCKDGTLVAVSLTVSPVVGTDGTVMGASTIAHDLSRHVEQMRVLSVAERCAAETLSTLETLQSSAPIGLGFVDREFRLVHLNEVLAAVNGSTVQDQLGKTVAEVVPEIWSQVETLYRRVLEYDESILNIEISGQTHSDPSRRHHWLASYYPVHLNTEIIGVGVVAVDVTERREAEEFRSIVMDQMAEGLFATNDDGQVTYMNAAVTRILGWTEADLKNKHLHDLIHTQHEDGTAILSEAECEHNQARATGASTNGDDVVFTCRDGSVVPVACSTAPLTTSTGGKGTVIVFRDITEEKAERLRAKRELAALTWVGRIREALDEDRLVLYAQPIVPLTGNPPGEELLLRMLDRKGKLILPDAFLPSAEKYGLITEIDQWVIKQAIRVAAEGRHVGANLSAESIMSFDLLTYIDQEIAGAGVDPSNLVFEITETALLGDFEKARNFAQGVVDLGCAVALDDFGTGFGTFTHLKNLSLKYLKIDMEFVRGLAEIQANQHVVKAVVTLAQGFGCQTIAEGVENEETLQLLRDFGVDFAQGFYMGPPAPL